MATITYFPPGGLPVGPGIVYSDSAGAGSVATGAQIVAAAGTTIPKRGANLTDADQTITPGTDLASEYWMVTATATRNITLSVAGGLHTYQVRMVNKSNQILVIKNGAGTTISTLAAATGTSWPTADCFFNINQWILSVSWYMTG